MNKRTYGILAGVIGSALGAWWYRRRHSAAHGSAVDRGTVIHENTPTASPLSSEGTI